MGKGRKFREYKAKAQIKLALPLVLKMAREVAKITNADIRKILEEIREEKFGHLSNNTSASI